MPLGPQSTVKTSEKLWAEVVAAAEAMDGIDVIKQPYDAAYHFSNNRKFYERNHYNTDPPQP